MSRLAEYLITTGKEISAKSRESQGLLKEWQDSVEQFMRDVQSLLEVADPDKVPYIRRTVEVRWEQRFGEYRLPAMDIMLGDTLVRVIPRSRFNVGRLQLPGATAAVPIEGRIDLKGPGQIDQAFRVPTPEGHKWFLSDEYCPPSGERTLIPFAIESIQNIVLELLR
jgi:hypothetical protein